MRLEYFYSSVLVVILSISYLNNQVFAWSFQDTWWFGESQSSSIGNIRIIYTYPDEVQSFEPKYNNNSMHVGVALQYIKDKSASANWVVFSNVYVYLKPNTSLSIPPVYSESNTSSAISPGESYYHTFSLKPQTASDYNVFLKLTALFGPGGGALESHEWDAREWYNKNPSAGGGNISPEQLPPLKVVKNLEHPSLTVRLQNPYGQIKPSKIAVCKANENFCEKECAIDKDNAHCKYTINGMANFTDLSPNDTYTVIVPKTIDIVPHKIRAIFSASSNGEKHVSNNDIEEIKNVNLRSNVELLTLYNTQYNLAVDVDLQDPIIGDGSESNSMLDSIFGAHPIPRHEDQKNLV